ncbi:MAG: CapA family protein, partial [Acetanaerobacterium sp.]
MTTHSFGSFLAAGDMFATRRLAADGYDGLSELCALIEKHDVRFANLEVTVHDREGYPFGFSGGTWAMAHPRVLDDLKRYGFNIFNAANNHSMDYSHNGLLATIRYLKEHDMPFAGIGENLADACAPTYIEGANLRASLVACTASF